MKRVTTIGFRVVATGCATASSPSVDAYPLKGPSAEHGGAGIGGTVAYTRSKESYERTSAAYMEPCGRHVR